MVTRGNVAIYCYNALTADTWDITSSEDGKLTSSAQGTKTILAKYFSDFVNDNNKMKIIEGAKVTASGALTSAIGVNQVRLDASEAEFEGTTAAAFLGVKESPKNKEEKTYGKGNTITAYVPAKVADIAALDGKKVDVIFGKDNEVAYIVVTDDAYTDVYVTAWDNAKAEIEIDGTEYEVKSNAEVSVFGVELPSVVVNAICTCGLTTEPTDKTKCVSGTTHTPYDADEYTAAALINGVFTELSCVTLKGDLTRNVIAEFVLDEDEDIESINFKFSADFTALEAVVTVDEYIVEKISDKNIVTAAGRDSKLDLEEVEEDDEPRVIRNGEIATLYDIEVGDVVTEISVDGKITTVIAVANTVEGEVADYVAKTNDLTVDGEDYRVIAAPLYNDEGEVDDYTTSTADSIYTLFEDETVTAYLNMAGEVVAVVGESEATGMILGVVTDDFDADTDDNDVDFGEIRILAEDGSDKKYTIYHERSGKDLAADDPARSLIAGNVVMFEANADRVIKANKIDLIADSASDLDFKANADVVVTKDTTVVVDGDAKTINGKRFSSSTIVINPVEKELISSWDVLVNGDNFVNNGTEKDTLTKAEYDALGTPEEKAEWIAVDPEHLDQGYYQYTLNKDIYVFTKGTKVVYVVAWIGEAEYGASEEQYGILLEVNKDKDEDDETIYVATVLVDGVEETYECDVADRNIEEGSFVSFKVSDGAFKDGSLKVLVNKDFTEVIADLKDDTRLVGYNGSIADIKALAVETITADSPTTAELKAKLAEYNAALAALTTINNTLGANKVTLTAVTKTESDFDTKVKANNAINDFNTDIDDVIEVLVTTFTETVDEYTIAYLEDVLELVDTTAVENTKTYEAIKVDSVEVLDGETYLVFEDENAATIDLAPGYIVYDLTSGKEIDTISEGDYVLYADHDAEDGYGIVIVLN